MCRRRLCYAVLCAVLLGVEIFIALCVRDNFIRPYVGDVLVVILIACFLRVLVPVGWRFLPLGVFLFAAAVEIGQYFDYASLLGLGENPFFRTLLGSTFSAQDLLCYAVGCILFAAGEKWILHTV